MSPSYYRVRGGCYVAARLHARFDDLVSRPPRHWAFAGQVAAGRADHLTEVERTIAAAEHQAQALGRWVVLAVSYESAAAFDAAMRTKRRPPPGQAYVQWASFERADPLGAASPPSRGASIGTTRRGNPVPFRSGVEAIRQRIAGGDVYQVNLCERFEGAIDGDVSGLYGGLLAGQSCEFGAQVDLGDRWIACASPELFFRWDGDTITCRPMKGTASRHPRPDVDAARAVALAASAKDRAENVMIVDLLRNDLSRIARLGSVRVPTLFAIERYETVWQMTSTLQGDVDADVSLVDVFRALFPCGSVTGAPKVAAMGIIDELEQEPRGIYCGALGYLAPPGHGPRAVFCVPIRTAVVDHVGVVTYGAGAGITWSSDAAAEDAEVDAKARVLTDPWPHFELLETLLLDERGLLHATQHLDRMEVAAAWFGIAFDRAAATRALDGLAPTSGAQRIRLLLSRQGRLRVESTELDDATASVRLALDTEITRSDDPFCCHKTTARDHYARALERHPGADDVVLVNEIGHAVETTTANLAFRRDARWWVPPLSDGGLAGVGRAAALADGRVAERSIAAVDLASCEELAVVSDLRGWRPATLVPPIATAR
jgi:para-aminobenzoate synthetase/4-amino-4-deoxychorismate lyase